MCYYNNCTGLASSILSRSISLLRAYRNVFTSRSLVTSLGTMLPKYFNMAIAAAIDVTIATDGLIGCLATAVAFTIAFVFPLQSETALSSVTNEQYHRAQFDDTIDGAIVYRSKTQRPELLSIALLLSSTIRTVPTRMSLLVLRIFARANNQFDLFQPFYRSSGYHSFCTTGSNR